MLTASKLFALVLATTNAVLLKEGDQINADSPAATDAAAAPVTTTDPAAPTATNPPVTTSNADTETTSDSESKDSDSESEDETNDAENHSIKITYTTVSVSVPLEDLKDAAGDMIWTGITKGDKKAESFDEPALFATGIYKNDEDAQKEFNEMDDDKDKKVNREEFEEYVDEAFGAAMNGKDKK